MNKFSSLLSAAFVLLMCAACSETGYNELLKQPSLAGFENSGCKTNGVEIPSSRVAPQPNGGSVVVPFKAGEAQVDDHPYGDREEIVLKAEANGRLLVRHNNLELPCDATIKTLLSVEGHTIYITEQQSGRANCMCEYDQQITIDNMEQSKYDVVMRHQAVDTDGKPFYDATAYKSFSFTYSGNLSTTIK